MFPLSHFLSNFVRTLLTKKIENDETKKDKPESSYTDSVKDPSSITEHTVKIRHDSNNFFFYTCGM